MKKCLKFLNEFFTKEERHELIINKLTYLKKIDNYFINKQTELKNLIKKYNFNNFLISGKYYDITIQPDEEFIELLNKYNDILKNKINTNLNITLSVDINRMNIIDFSEHFKLPKELRGLLIGYKLYKLIIKKYKFITSDKDCTDEAIGVWYKLMIDEDLYCFTSNIFSGVILKNIDDILLKSIIEDIKNKIIKYEISFNDLILDDQLKEKIKIIYGI